MKKIFLLTAVVTVFALALLPARGVAASDASNKLRSAESIIENYYVDDVDADSMVAEAIIAMLKTLDPHSSYSTPEETKALEEPLQGNFSGIGVTFNLQSDTVFIIQPTAGGPSERVGILPGDRIIMVDDTLVSGVKMPRKEIMKRIRGPKGTDVRIKVFRPGVKNLIDFVITRDDIPIYSVDAAYMVDDNVGYIRLSRFAADTPDEVNKAMAQLRAQGMKHVMIDLQDNGGGYLTAATALAEMFLKRGDKIVFTQSSRTNPKYYVAERTGNFGDGRVVVLVNQYTASASEILSGALQDNDRGAIVGRRTFGKGLVQRPFRFNDGSMMRLTISRYYTPSGRCIQKPYSSGDDKDYRDDMSARLRSGELMSADSIHFDLSQLYHTANGRPVYGGGGIMPDRFVGLDTAFFTPYYRDLVAKGVLNKFVVNHLDNNRKALTKKYRKESQFLSDFNVTDAMLADIVAMGVSEGVEYNDEEWALSRDYVRYVVKAILGRDLFEQATYYKVMNPRNPIYIDAYELISSPEQYNALLTIGK